MQQRNWREYDVLIGGAGIAAASAAIRLLALGFRPLLLATKGHITPGIEAIPEAAMAMFAELGIENVIREAGGVLVEGFENHWQEEDPVVRSGRWIHLDRSMLAKAAMREAVRRGAILHLCKALPPLTYGPTSACITLDGMPMDFEAAIDATGRSAVWSRPITRRGTQVADLFSCPSVSLLRGRVVKEHARWCYRIGLERSTTLAIVANETVSRKTIDSRTQQALGVANNDFSFTGRRPAFPQWCEKPVQRRRLAIGDAALAYDPLAGQGICFAVSSAIASSAVVNTWRHTPAESAIAERFYFEFVAQRRRRHLENLHQLQNPKRPEEPIAMRLPSVLVFSGQTGTSGVQIGSKIVTEEVVLLPDGSRVRWAGGVDLLHLRDLARQPISAGTLVEHLVSPRNARHDVVALLAWCVEHRLIDAAVQP